MKMKTLLSYIFLGCGFLPPVFAESKFEEKVNSLEKKVVSIMTTDSLGNTSAKLNSARGTVEGQNVFLFADVLYLHPKMNGTTFASSTGKVDVLDPTPFSGQAKENSFGWDYGLRVGIGSNVDHDQWELNLYYTRFKGSNSSSLEGSSVDALIALKGSYTGPLEIAKSFFTLNIESVDFDLERSFFVSENLVIKPVVAIKTAWIDEKQRIDYTGGAFLGVNSFYDVEKCNFWGVGPKVGLDTLWYIDHGIHVFANALASFLYGSFDIKHREKISNDANTVAKMSLSKHMFSPIAELNLGFGWRGYANENKLFIDLEIGYELSYYWNQYQVLEIVDFITKRYDVASYDICLQGAFARFKITF